MTKKKTTARRAPVKYNARNTMDGRTLLDSIGPGRVATVIFDPQYRGVLAKLGYGNEGARQKGRASLKQMAPDVIAEFLEHIERVLRPSGHLMMWVDKFHLCEGDIALPEGLKRVDLITWNKLRFGMGYRTRRCSEYLLICQKLPIRAKGVWKDHGIRDVWDEQIPKELRKLHPHVKPWGLTQRLIECTTRIGDLVVDPCAGSYSTLEACSQIGRKFLGCDLK